MEGYGQNQNHRDLEQKTNPFDQHLHGSDYRWPGECNCFNAGVFVKIDWSGSGKKLPLSKGVKMFWQKKPIEKLIDKWKNEIDALIFYDEDTNIIIKAFLGMLDGIWESAMMVKPNETRSYFQKYKESLDLLIKGSFAIGLEFGDREKLSIEDAGKMRQLSTEVTLPIISISMEIIEISHCPGRIVLLPEDKESVKKSTEEGIKKVANRILSAGATIGIYKNLTMSSNNAP